MTTKRISACPYCGSRDIEPEVIFGGPMAGVDNQDGGYICHQCGRKAVPLDFVNQTELRAFKEDNMEHDQASKSFMHIPIMPVDTRSILTLAGIEIPLGSVAEVVTVRWNGERLVRTEYSAKFSKYWKAVSGQRYNASEVMLMDLAGIMEARPNFDVLRQLLKRKYNVWLEIGMRNEDDLFDAFAMGVSYAVAGSLCCRNIDMFTELFELSDKCIPCLYLDDGVVWERPGSGPKDMDEAIEALKVIGFHEIAIIDLPRLGTRSGYSKELVAKALGHGIALHIGGGITENDFESLEKMGVAGALVDPFTPIITDIIESPEGSAATTIKSTPTRFDAPSGTSTGNSI
ncbi:MAG: HisA/HisF-related TIM barrel protein [Methanomassiliicoccales archaeon]|jgi:uncharacterized protein related to proFAR isomerase/DNA-directed RNA polymerase subunit RPC12/RpoP